jgi:hypothetical protein
MLPAADPPPPLPRPRATLCSFMKLRLDRVLKIDLSALPEDEVLTCGEALPEFKPPAVWKAPYPMYTPGWWEVFYPKK